MLAGLGIFFVALAWFGAAGWQLGAKQNGAIY